MAASLKKLPGLTANSRIPKKNAENLRKNYSANITFLLYFGINTIWYVQLYLLCAKLWLSIDISVVFYVVSLRFSTKNIRKEILSELFWITIQFIPVKRSKHFLQLCQVDLYLFLHQSTDHGWTWLKAFLVRWHVRCWNESEYRQNRNLLTVSTNTLMRWMKFQ